MSFGRLYESHVVHYKYWTNLKLSWFSLSLSLRDIYWWMQWYWCVYIYVAALFTVLNCYKVYNISLLPFLLGGGKLNRNDNFVSIWHIFHREWCRPSSVSVTFITVARNENYLNLDLVKFTYTMASWLLLRAKKKQLWNMNVLESLVNCRSMMRKTSSASSDPGGCLKLWKEVS